MKTTMLQTLGPRLVGILFSLSLALLGLTSCGLIDFELDETETMGGQRVTIRLNRDSVYAMVGDTFDIQAGITSAGILSDAIFWHADHDSVVSFASGTVTARTPGETWIRVVSVKSQQTDSCYVRVLPQWALDPTDFSADMVVYATVNVGGQDFDPRTMRLAAVCGNEVRALGELLQWQGRNYVLFRIYSDMNFGRDGKPADVIRFCYYDRSRLRFGFFDQYFRFDGETHGSLSSPFQLTAP